MLCGFFILLVVSFAVIRSEISSKCTGKWIQKNETTSSNHFFGLNKAFDDDSYHSKIDMARKMCSVESFSFSCYFRGDTERAYNVSHRDWVVYKSVLETNEHCAYTLELLLQQIKNKRLIFIGDSVGMEIWSALVCTLEYYYGTAVDVEAMSLFLNAASPQCFTEALCPFKEFNCQFHTFGTATFPKLNLTIMYAEVFEYNHSRNYNNLPKLHEKYKFNSDNDLIFFNNGLHFNNGKEGKSQYRVTMKSFAEDYNSFQNNHIINNRMFFFLETVPQNFDTDVGSFGNPKQLRTCVDIPLHSRNDWRNHIAAEILYEDTDIEIIEIAKELYSQWDAHIGGHSRASPDCGADCTHYCLSSGVFPYIFRMIYYALLKTGKGELKIDTN